MRDALALLDPTGHDYRVRIGMAIHSEFPGEDGFALFDEWCQRGDSYSAAEVRDSWRSFKPGRITIATLWHEAKRRGFKRKRSDGPAPTPADRAREKREREQARAIEEAKRRKRADAAAREAVRRWGDASEQGDSPYLARKGVRGHGVRYLPDGTLLVPMRNAAGELVCVQSIAPSKPTAEEEARGKSDKRYLPGGRKAGSWHLLGELAGAAVVIVCEGYATAASVHEATGRPVAVAFDTGNLRPVALALQASAPTARLLIAGDDDKATEGRTGKNPGRVSALAAARAVRGAAVFPQGLADGAKDWNDLHQAAGLAAVREQIERAAQSLAGVAIDTAEASVLPEPDKRSSGPPGEPAGPADRFTIDDAGVWYADPAGDGAMKHVCGPLHAVALARDQRDNRAALLLRFDTRFRAGRQWLMPLAMLAGDGAGYRAGLLARGFVCPTDAKRRAWLTEYLRSRTPDELVRHVSRVGWVGRCYVLPEETLGTPAGDRVIFHSEAGIEANFSTRGTLDLWKANLARLCVGNSRLAFAVSVAFAGPLLAWAPGTSGGGWHYVGDTSTGKTTGLLVAASVWGKGTENDPESFMQKWLATKAGLEFQGEQHNDCTLILDELGQIEPNEAGASAYMLADGQGKARSKHGDGLRPKPTWRLLFLSSGELTLAQHMESAGKRMKGGQEVRLIPLPAEVAPGSTLETVHEFDTGHELSIWVRAQAARHYGWAGREWLLWLTSRTEDLAMRVREGMERFESRYVRDEMAGQVKRGARRFALAAAAGELATEAGLTGWPQGEAITAAGAMFNAWIATRPGGIGTSEAALILRDLRQWFGMFGEMNFKRWGVTDSDHAPATPMMSGWRREVMGDERNAAGELVSVPVGRVWYVLAEQFRSVVCKGHSPKLCLDVLKARGWIELAPDGRALHNARPPGHTKAGVSVYRIKSDLLGDFDE
ncbi:MAG: DUF927 domain-containing protein [Burkholderiaceae bacterium]